MSRFGVADSEYSVIGNVVGPSSIVVRRSDGRGAVVADALPVTPAFPNVFPNVYNRMQCMGTRLDYGNAVLVGLPAYLVQRLQSLLNAAARVIFHLRSADHITDALATLHFTGCALRSGSNIRSPC